MRNCSDICLLKSKELMCVYMHATCIEAIAVKMSTHNNYLQVTDQVNYSLSVQCTLYLVCCVVSTSN